MADPVEIARPWIATRLATDDQSVKRHNSPIVSTEAIHADSTEKRFGADKCFCAHKSRVYELRNFTNVSLLIRHGRSDPDIVAIRIIEESARG